MKYVVVERPRGGHKNKIYIEKRCKQIPMEELPKFEPMGQMYSYRYKDKSLSDLLGPLRRFLYSKVGQDWNTVRSEISAVLKADSVMKIHVLSHINGYVEENSEVIGEIRVVKARHGKHYNLPLKVNELNDDELYVDDEGKLSIYKRKKYIEPKKKNHVILGDVVLQELKGVWYKADLVWDKYQGSSAFYDWKKISYPSLYKKEGVDQELLPLTYGEKKEVLWQSKTRAEFLAELEKRKEEVAKKNSHYLKYQLEKEEEYFRKNSKLVTSTTTVLYRVARNKKQLNKKELVKFGLKNG